MNTISSFLKESTKNLNDVKKFFNEKFIFINFDTTTYNIEKTKELFKKNTENTKKIKEFLDYFYKHMNIGAREIIISSGIELEKNKILTMLG